MFSDFDADAAAAGGLFTPAEDVNLQFKVLLKGQDVGDYTFAVRPSANRRDMNVAHKFLIRVKIGFITAFRFEHEADETWADGRLQHLVSQTSDNGDKVQVLAERKGSQIHINGPGGPSVADGDRLTTTCAWNPAFVAQSEIIDAMDGSVVSLVTKENSTAQTPVASGYGPATEYEFVSPHLAGTLWYLEKGSLVKAAFERKGHKLSLIKSD